MKILLMSLAVIAGVFLFPHFAYGHHGLAAYDSGTTVTLPATVTAFRFVNPHCIVEFDVKDDKGQIQNWQGELTSPNRLSRVGWTATSLKPGEEIAITGYKAKSGKFTMWITKMVSASGQEIRIVGGN